MGYALIWVEGLAIALLGIALAMAWATRGGALRWLWEALVYLLFLGAAGALSFVTLHVDLTYGKHIQSSWFFFTFTWLGAYVGCGLFLRRKGHGRPHPGTARSAAAWPRGKLWLGFAGAVLALCFTFWNLDLAARADLAIARQEAGAMLLAITPPAVPDAENAARIYEQAAKIAGKDIEQRWREAVYRGLDCRDAMDWNDPHVVGLVKEYDSALTLYRKAAAMPRCSFDYQPGMLDAASNRQSQSLPWRGLMLLALDARVKAAEGDLTRAFEDVSAIFGIVKHISAVDFFTGQEVLAWRTLEEVLRLTTPSKAPLPLLSIPEQMPLVRKVRGEHALLAMILPAAASQPSLVFDEIRKQDGPWVAFLSEAAVVPTRVFLITDDVAAMRRSIAYYRMSPRSSRDESPRDWADLFQSVETDRTSLYGVIYIRPKQQQLLLDGAALAALRQTGKTGLAVEAYRHKHGRHPERLEELVPGFLPAVPVDPRDGQPLRLERSAEGVIIHARQDSPAIERKGWKDTESRMPAPIFRLYSAPSTVR